MSVNREELKQMIDQISEQDALEVYDFIEYLNTKHDKAKIEQKLIDDLSNDEDLIRQVYKSREDRGKGNTYSKEQGLEYLRNILKES